jgi:hypothetical protein
MAMASGCAITGKGTVTDGTGPWARTIELRPVHWKPMNGRPILQDEMAAERLAQWRGAERDTAAARGVLSMADLALLAADSAMEAALAVEEAARLAVEAADRARLAAQQARKAARGAASISQDAFATAEGDKARAQQSLARAEEAEERARGRYHGGDHR